MKANGKQMSFDKFFFIFSILENYLCLLTHRKAPKEVKGPFFPPLFSGLRLKYLYTALVRGPMMLRISLLFLIIFQCLAYGAQDAIVISDKAIVYSDVEMTSAVGYIRQGKKIKVGEIPRNKAQVYPIRVSGKIGYIRVLDVSTERESMDSQNLTAERFKKTTHDIYKTHYSGYLYRFNSGISDAGDDVDETAFTWTGVGVKGDVVFAPRWDLEVLMQYMSTEDSNVTFRAVEIGMGSSYYLIEAGNFLLRLGGQLMAIPFSNYAVGSDFRVNGFGFSLGGGLNTVYRLGKKWGLEGFAGLYYTKLTSFDAPSPYQSISPVFVGSRVGLGLNYQY
jgi:hypothetical protein